MVCLEHCDWRVCACVATGANVCGSTENDRSCFARQCHRTSQCLLLAQGGKGESTGTSEHISLIISNGQVTKYAVSCRPTQQQTLRPQPLSPDNTLEGSFRRGALWVILEDAHMLPIFAPSGLRMNRGLTQ